MKTTFFSAAVLAMSLAAAQDACVPGKSTSTALTAVAAATKASKATKSSSSKASTTSKVTASKSNSAKANTSKSSSKVSTKTSSSSSSSSTGTVTGVTGTCPGFANGVTGGAAGETVYPTTIDELKTYLTASDPYTIIISGTFDFQNSEGTQTEEACFPYSCTPENGGQGMLNTLNTCSTATSEVTIDTAAYQGIDVTSDKTLIGTGTNTVLLGKGLRMVDVENIIIQNIEITNLNPKYIWGGDAISMSGTSKIWIDHVKTSLTGRQHYSFGQEANKLITISNSFINGSTPYSTSCDGYHYWTMELVGVDDQISFVNNYVYKTSGRSPALSGSTLFHSVNSVWSDNNGHAIEGDKSGMGLFEGTVWEDVTTVVVDDFVGVGLFAATSSNAADCQSALGRSCVANEFDSSGTFDYSDTGFLTNLTDLNVATASAAAAAKTSVPLSAGNTLS